MPKKKTKNRIEKGMEQLDVSGIYDDFFEGCRLIGITMPLAPHIFCWTVNRQLGYRFRLGKHLEMEVVKKKRRYLFPLYESHEALSRQCHVIYYNRCDGGFLLPEFKHLDYIWMVKNFNGEEPWLDWHINCLKQLDDVQLATKLDMVLLEQKENLVYDFLD